MREYCHAMGNSVGNLQEHVDALYRHPHYVGAAIWDWVDQAIAKPQGRNTLRYPKDPSKLSLEQFEYWAYGGDFGDQPNDGDFCLNGLVGADRVPYPQYFEVQKAYQNVVVQNTESPGTLVVTNRFDFTNLNQFRWKWEVSADGRVVEGGEIAAPDIPPGQTGQVAVPGFAQLASGPGERTGQIYVTLTDDQTWAPAGFAVAREQFVLQDWKFTPEINATEGSIEVRDAEDSIVATGPDFTVEWDANSGALTSWLYREQQIVAKPLEPYFWKPANRNQNGNDYDQRLKPWKTSAQKREIANTRIEPATSTGTRQVEFDYRLPNVDAEGTLSYQLHPSGQIKVLATYQPTNDVPANPTLPKFGLRMGLAGQAEHLSWYGRGPFENYEDRKTAALLGRYESGIEQFMTPYPYPQDNGARTDLRWLTMRTGSGLQFRVDGYAPFIVRAWPYEESDLASATHHHELPTRRLRESEH